MLFKYTTIDESGVEQEGTIEALNKDVAISALQRRGLVISSIESEENTSLLEKRIGIFEHVSNKDIVILSRQIATLFDAQVSALKIFNLLSEETPNPVLQDALGAIARDLQAGSSVAKAMEKHPDIFSTFYVNMVRSGEESGRLDETFLYLADYLDRTYELTSKAKNALVYPAFVIFTFVAVMILMFTVVIPKISGVLLEAGQEIPIYTQIVIGISDFLVNYGLFLLILLVIGGYFAWRHLQTRAGKELFSRLKISLPYLGDLYRKLYLSRLADNMNTMLASGIPMVRALEVTSSVIDNAIYENILAEVVDSVRGGEPVSEALSKYDEIPAIMTQMMKIGEETGKLGSILKTLAHFYRREVNNAVDTLVGLIEPVMIVLLGAGVGILLASVLIPIYNVSTAI